MPTVLEMREGSKEERHTLWLCAGVSESPYTAHFTRFFPFDRIPTHFIYTSKL